MLGGLRWTRPPTARYTAVYLTLLSCQALADLQTIAEHRELNGTREGDRYRPATTTAISLAIQTDAGLVAPVVMDPAAYSALHGRILDFTVTCGVLLETS